MSSTWVYRFDQLDAAESAAAGVQRLLADAGVFNGNIDGNIGRKTRAAIGEFLDMADDDEKRLYKRVLDKLTFEPKKTPPTDAWEAAGIGAAAGEDHGQRLDTERLVGQVDAGLGTGSAAPQACSILDPDCEACQ